MCRVTVLELALLVRPVPVNVCCTSSTEVTAGLVESRQRDKLNVSDFTRRLFELPEEPEDLRMKRSAKAGFLGELLLGDGVWLLASLATADPTTSILTRWAATACPRVGLRKLKRPFDLTMLRDLDFGAWVWVYTSKGWSETGRGGKDGGGGVAVEADLRCKLNDSLGIV